MSGSTPHLPACSCCGKLGNKVDKLIQIAEDFYICNNCVEICVNMIVKDTGLPMATRFIRGILNMEPSAYAMCPQGGSRGHAQGNGGRPGLL